MRASGIQFEGLREEGGELKAAGRGLMYQESCFRVAGCGLGEDHGTKA